MVTCGYTGLLFFRGCFVFAILAHISTNTAHRTEEDAPHDYVPKQVEEKKEEKRGKYVALHPPDKPVSLGWMERSCIIGNKSVVSIL